MTQPVQEPLTQRSISSLNWGVNQLQRRPPLTGGCCPAWMTVYDNLPYAQEINSADGLTVLEYPYCDWSDNAVGIFDYVRSASTIGASNNYNIQILRDGVYSITYSEISEDMGGPNYSVKYTLNLGMEYPGRDSSIDPSMKTYNVTDFQTASGAARSWSIDHLFLHDTMVLPMTLIDDNPGTVYPSVTFEVPAGASNFDINFRNRLWITWHGPIEHADDIEDHRDPYPYHPEDF